MRQPFRKFSASFAADTDCARGKSVIWRFDTPSWTVEALADFVLELAQGRQIRVYVAEPILYLSDI